MARIVYGSVVSIAAAVAVTVAGLALFMSGEGSSSSARAAEQVRGAPPTPTPLPRSSPAVAEPQGESASEPQVTVQPAQVEPYEQTEMFAKASGFVAEVNVDIGDRVKKGDLLARLQIPEMEVELLRQAALVDEAKVAVQSAQAQVEAAKARIGAAEAQLAAARAAENERQAEVAFRRGEHERMSRLVANQSVNQALLEEKLNSPRASEASLGAATANVSAAEAEIRVRTAEQTQAESEVALGQARLKVAQTELRRTEVLSDYASIRAPFDGVVSRRWVDAGDFVTSAASAKTDPIFSVDRVDRLRVVFDVPERESTLVAVGQPISLQVDALMPKTYSGVVARTAGRLNDKTRSLRVEAELDENDGSLLPGMFGMVRVQLVETPDDRVAGSRNTR